MEKENICCDGKFPTFAVILLVVGLVWLLNDLKVLAINLPWVPIVLVIIAVGMIVNRYKSK